MSSDGVEASLLVATIQTNSSAVDWGTATTTHQMMIHMLPARAPPYVVQ